MLLCKLLLDFSTCTFLVILFVNGIYSSLLVHTELMTNQFVTRTCIQS